MIGRSVPLRELIIATKDGDWGESALDEVTVPYRVIRGADFPKARVGDLSEVPLRFLRRETVGRRTLKPNDILIETAGGSRDRPTGRTLLITARILGALDSPATCASFCRFLRANCEKVDPRYLYWYFQHIYQQGVMWEHQVQHTGVARFQFTKFYESLRVPLPTFAEQEAIAQVLSALDDKIELNRRMNQTLEAMARAIFKSWFVDFEPLRDIGVPFQSSTIGNVPNGWSVKPLSEVFEINPSRPIKSGCSAPYLDMAGMPTQSARALAWTYREFGSGMRFVNGDVLVARITPCLENGKTAFVDFLEEGQVGWGSTEYIVLRSKPPLPKEYAYFLARSEAFRSHAISNMTGTTGRQRVPVSCFDSLKVAVPSEPLAMQFGKFASGVIAALKQRDEESQTLTELRDALLPKLLSGEIRVKQAEKIVGEVV